MEWFTSIVLSEIRSTGEGIKLGPCGVKVLLNKIHGEIFPKKERHSSTNVR